MNIEEFIEWKCKLQAKSLLYYLKGHPNSLRYKFKSLEEYINEWLVEFMSNEIYDYITFSLIDKADRRLSFNRIESYLLMKAK